MDKPFSIIYEEFKQELTNLINNSNIPAPILELILQNYLYEISNIAKNQYITDRMQYEKSLLDKNEKEEKK